MIRNAFGEVCKIRMVSGPPSSGNFLLCDGENFCDSHAELRAGGPLGRRARSGRTRRPRRWLSHSERISFAAAAHRPGVSGGPGVPLL